MEEEEYFWELSYWEVLDVRHAIDVMHLTKNLCVNLLGFLGVYGKPKDTLEARHDLQRMKKGINDVIILVRRATLLVRKRSKVCSTV